jgi:hypothetical protein
VPTAAGRVIGATEIAVGALGIVAGGAAGALVIVAYTSFFAFAVALRRRAPGTACGCIGDRSSTVGVGHLAICAGATVATLVYTTGGGDGAVAVLRDQPVAGVPFAALVVCCTALTALLIGPGTGNIGTRSWQH